MAFGTEVWHSVDFNQKVVSMYLPENNEQMFDILSDLRVYAATNALPGLAEELDDALIQLEAESRRVTAKIEAGQSAGDKF